MKKRQLVLKSRGGGGGGGGGDDHPTSHSSANSLRTVRYAECQKNHAANVGGYAVDGCREFMPCGQEGTSGALTCAACGCHRNFHRREVDGEAATCDGCNM